MLPDLPTNFPAYSGRMPRVGGNARADPARRGLRDVLRRQVASRAARSAGHGPVRHVADRTRFRPLLRIPQRRDQPVDAESRARHEPCRAADASPPTDITSTPTSPTTRSPTCASSASRIPTGRSCSGTHRPRRTRPHQAPPEWIDRFRGQFDDGWDAWRDATLARQIELGILPAGTTLLGTPVVDRGVVDDRRTSPSAVRADDGSVRRVHRARRSSHRPRPRPPRGDRRSRQHRRACSSPTTARRARAARTAPTTNSATTSPTSPTTSPTSSRTSTTSAASARAVTTRGDGRSPATRRSGGGSATRSKAACATRSSSPVPVSPTRAASASSTATPPTCSRPCSSCAASRCPTTSTASSR